MALWVPPPRLAARESTKNLVSSLTLEIWVMWSSAVEVSPNSLKSLIAADFSLKSLLMDCETSRGLD